MPDVVEAGEGIRTPTQTLARWHQGNLLAGRERLLLQARNVVEKATATRSDIAAAVADAVRRHSARASGIVNEKR